MSRLFPLLALLFALPVGSADPSDRDPRPEEWGYHPEDGSVTPVNPPSLTWIHDEKAVAYAVQWSAKTDFSDAVTVGGIRWCVYTHSEPLKAGAYVWRYRVTRKGGEDSDWSRARRFSVPPDATPFPMPTLAALTARVPKAHPRLYVRPEDLPRLKTHAEGEGKADLDALRRRADALLKEGPTPEPTVRGSKSDEKTREFWWSNRMQTEKACMEAEALAFAWLLTGETRYGEGARRWLLHLASWDPDGPTQIALNCEAAKPMLYRVSRAYDWAYDALAPEDRAKVAAAMRRRGQDAWKHGEMKQGHGHLSQPYRSHGNRIWHKMGELAIAFLGDVPEAETWLDYAVNKFYAAYPVWSDDDGGWHEGLSYLSSYMSKFVTWAGYAKTTLGIESFQKPFQWMLHGLSEFKLEGERDLVLNRGHAGLRVQYVAPPGLELTLRQWTGFEPDVDKKYLDAVKKGEFPPQWHAEAATAAPRDRAFVLTVLRPYRAGKATDPVLKVTSDEARTVIRFPAPDGASVEVEFRNPTVGAPGAAVGARSGDRKWAFGK